MCIEFLVVAAHELHGPWITAALDGSDLRKAYRNTQLVLQVFTVYSEKIWSHTVPATVPPYGTANIPFISDRYSPYRIWSTDRICSADSALQISTYES